MRFLNTIGNRFTGRTDLSSQYQRYRQTLLWIATELIRFDRKKTLLAVSCNILGGLLKAGALALLLYYANLMERSASINLLGYSWDSRSEAIFYIALLVALVLLFCGSLVVFLGTHITNILTLTFASHYSKAVMCATGGRPARNPDPSEETFPPSVRHGVTGIIGIVRGVKPVLQVSGPLSTLLYSILVLFYLNSLVTLMVVLLALLSLLFQYKVNFQSVQNEGALLESRRAAKKWLGSMFDDLVLTPRIYRSREEWIEQEYRGSVISEFLQQYYQRLIARPRSALVGDMLLAILLFLVVAYLGGQALAGKIGWAHFIAYLLFVRISLMAFRGFLVSITGFARHYHRIRRISEYCKSLKVPECRDVKPLVVAARGEDNIGDNKKIKVKPDEPVFILSRVPLTRFNLYAFVDALTGRDIESNNIVCAGTACISRGFSALPGGSVSELMALPETVSPEYLADRYRLIGLEKTPAMDERDTLLSDEAWRAYSRQTRACMLLEQAKEEAVRLVLADATVLAECGDVYLEQWRKVLGEKLVGIVSDDIQVLGQFDCKFVLLMASDRSVSVAAVPWCLDNIEVIEDWFERHSVQPEADLDEEAFDDE